MAQFEPFEKTSEKQPVRVLTDCIVDKAARQFVESLSRAKNKLYTKRIVYVPETVDARMSRAEISIERLNLKISKTINKIHRKIDVKMNEDILKELQTTRDLEIDELMDKKINNDIISRNNKSNPGNSFRYEKWAKAKLNKSSYSYQYGTEKTEEEEKMELDAYDKTFRRDYEKTPNLDEYVDIIPEKNFTKTTTPAEVQTLLEKLKKVDKDFIRFSKPISKPLSLLINLILHEKYYPKIFRTSKCTLLPDRAIFSLSPIPKVIEQVIKIGMDEMKPADDGTGQMAFTAKRGTELCLAMLIFFMQKTKEPVVQTLQDSRKAFNFASRKDIIDEAQTKFGLGKLFRSWLTDRTYTYKDEIRGQQHNSGVPAGTLLGVEGFLLFIATCKSLTSLNAALLWACLFADDQSPSATLTQVKNGNFQKALDDAYQWSKDKNVEFHMSGKKGPKYIAYLKGNQKFPQEFDKLLLGETKFERIYETKLLGIVIRVRKDDDKNLSQKMKKNGFEISWRNQQLNRIAIRISQLAINSHPDNVADQIQSYLCGTIRYGSCLKWIFSTEKEKNQANFIYGKALSSLIGITPAEALDLGCTSAASITQNNSKMEKLLEYTNFQSIYEISCQNAFSTIKQIQNFVPEYFVFGSKRYRKNNVLARNVTNVAKNTIFADLLDMAKKYEKAEKKKFAESKFRKMVEKFTSKMSKNYKIMDLKNMITISSMDLFNSLEGIEAIENFKASVHLHATEDEEGFTVFKTHKRKHAERETTTLEPIKVHINRFAVLEPKDEKPKKDIHILEINKTEPKAPKCKKMKREMKPCSQKKRKRAKNRKENGTEMEAKKNKQSKTDEYAPVFIHKTYDPKIWEYFKLVCTKCKEEAMEKDHLKKHCKFFHGKNNQNKFLKKKRMNGKLRKSKEQMMFELGREYDRG